MTLPTNINDRENQKFKEVPSGNTAIYIADDFSGIRGPLYYGKVFGSTISALNLPTAGADNPVLLFKNPAGSGVNAWIYRMRVGVETANRRAHFHKLAGATIVGNGTALSPCNCNSSYQGVNTPACTAYSTPSITIVGAIECDTTVIGVEQNSFNMLDGFECILGPDSYFVVTGNPSGNNTSCSISIKWVEESI